MNNQTIAAIVAAQRAYFNSGETLPYKTRRNALLRLRRMIHQNESAINHALHEDLGKSPEECYMCETGLTLTEISHMLRHLEFYMHGRTVPTPLAQFASHSYVSPSPYGTVLIISPWNYPFLLTIAPLVDALAAGNTAVVKPSAYAPATSALLNRLLSRTFPPELVKVVTGGRQENTGLLEQKWDMIFFTGSQNVGREVLRHAAENLTPSVLELGGKSPCIVDETANLKLAARRIVWGKFLNCGQTCVAPDYILVQENVKDQLLQYLAAEVTRQFGSDPLHNPYYGKIINQKHFNRICALIDPDKVVFGGGCDPAALKIAPTVMDGVTGADAVMGEEIFGPVLPVLTFHDIREIPRQLADKPKPLSLYIFSSDHRNIRYIHSRCRFGGGCVNDCIIHLATSAMGFGGVGESGMGAYHGKAGFDGFSHSRSIVDKKTWLDMPMRYQPYTKIGTQLIRLFMH